MMAQGVACSFCRKGDRLLVEGPEGLHICGECAVLCQEIIEQEQRRRNPPPDSAAAGPDTICAKLDQLIGGQDQAKRVLAEAACSQSDYAGRILFLGANRSAKVLLARALAHILGASFAAVDGSEFTATKEDSGPLHPVLYKLLYSSDFDLVRAQRGILYVDGAEGEDVQEALLQFWHGPPTKFARDLEFNTRTVLTICGGVFAAKGGMAIPLETDLQKPVAYDALIAAGARPAWAGSLTAVARVEPLDDDGLLQIVQWVDFSRASKQLNPSAAK